MLFLVLFLLLPSPSSSSSSNNHCDPNSLPDPLTLRSDKLTVLISGYSPSRIPLLRSIALSYSSHPKVLSVLILWFNPSSPLPSSLLSSSLPSSISILPSPSPSLSSRFLPRGTHILTRSVLISDDDLLLPSPSLSSAFRLSLLRHHRPLLGFFARSHEFDLGTKSWIYTVHPDRYSIVLTKVMIVRTDYLYRYSCDERLREAREYVERERNCEDILMNFVAAMEGGEGPVVVEARGGVRDWGDPRNDNFGSNSNSNSSSSSSDGGGGLSLRKDHRKKRGECIREFHRLIGEMPLRYSYGKVVEGVGEQGLCKKGGKLVYCDKGLI